jgi:hypothetical protein
VYDPDVDELIDDLLEGAEIGVPVRAMERLLAAGPAAVPALVEEIDALCAEEPPEDLDFGLVYMTVVLGELRDERAAPLLARLIEWADDNAVVAGAAADALACLGSAALPELRRLQQSAVERTRYWAYYAAGCSAADGAADLLLAGLETDPVLADVIALALVDAGAANAIEPLYRALLRAEPWQRTDIEGAIVDLHAGRRTRPEDWRFRYRASPLGRVPANWAVLADFIRSSPELRDSRPTPPLRPLAEILAERDDEEEEAETCDCCGVPVERVTGVPVCPKMAPLVPTLQAGELLKAAGDNDCDIMDLLDELEAELEAMDAAESGAKRRGRAARRRHEDELTRLRLLHTGAIWAAKQGAQTAGEAAALLLEQGRTAVRRHGDREGASAMIETIERMLAGDEYYASAPPEHAVDPFAGTGRNDPCPCGSGRKYKKCHGTAGTAGAPAAGQPAAGRPGGGRPRLVTFDNEPVSLSRAHYTATDRDAVIAALDGCPELDRTPDSRTVRYDWAQQTGPNEWRHLGSIEVRAPDRVTLECLSRERLERGKALLERAAGAWLVHRSDTEQDPWQAAAAAKPADRSTADAVPPEVAGPAIRQVLDNVYRTWPDEPLPALGGRTAREAVRDRRGRTAVIELLRSFDQAELGKPEPLRYDFGWIWQELGIAAERGTPRPIR